MAYSADIFNGGSSRRSIEPPRLCPAHDGAAHLRYRPIVGLVGGEIRGLRATIPEGDSAWPQLLAESCRRLGSWRRDLPGAGPLTVAARLAAPRLADPRLPVEIAEALDAGGAPASGLLLEVPEAVVLDDPRRWSVTLGALRSLGVRLHVADFGGGFRSFSHLRLFPVDGVTIGPRLVAGIGGPAGSPAGSPAHSMIAAVVAVARPLDLEVVAPGVAQQGQARQLRALGCDAADGPLYGAPLSATEVPAALAG